MLSCTEYPANVSFLLPPSPFVLLSQIPSLDPYDIVLGLPKSRLSLSLLFCHYKVTQRFSLNQFSVPDRVICLHNPKLLYICDVYSLFLISSVCLL